MKQLILDLAWEPLPPFAGFMPGENAAALAHLRDLPGPGAPIYLWGPAGCGKTQLLHELEASAEATGRAVQWFDTTTTAPWVLADDTTLALLDGAEQWDAAQQHAAFTLFVEVATRPGVQIAAAGRLPPVDLPLREDLRTRLGWGIVHAIHPLADADTRRALFEEAGRHGIVLRDDVLDYLLHRFARDLKSLMHLLHRLDGFALAEKRAVNVALLKRMLDEEGATSR
jgi:DnaA family protein